MTYDKDGYALSEGDREQRFQELLQANISYSIEPGVSLQSCEEVLQICAEYPGRIFPAIGIHPTRSIYEKWSDWHKLDAYANTPGVIHCFYCSKEIAEQYLKLGYHIGIVGSVLQLEGPPGGYSQYPPLNRILVETDAPSSCPIAKMCCRRSSCAVHGIPL